MRGILFSCLHRPVCGWSNFASAGRAGFVVLFSVCVFTIAVVFNACDSRGGMASVVRDSVDGVTGSGGAPPPDSNSGSPRQAAVVSLDEALAAVDAFSGFREPGDGSADLSESLKNALRSALANTGKDRFTAGVPTGDAGRIRDIAYDMDTLALTWTYSNDGDYDLNGSVGVPDITAIANNYLGNVTYSEETYSDGRFIPAGDPATPEGAANWYLAFIDTDGSGDIGIADITAIANNYLNDVAGYAVFANDDPNAPLDEWNEITRITLNQAKDALQEGFTFPITFTATVTEDDGLFAMVRPYDSTGAFGDSSEIVPLSTSVAPKIYAVTPNEGIEGRVIQFLVVTTGVAPITYRWSIGGAFPTSSTKESPTVILSTSGQYTCSVTAENDYGTDYFQFTLTVTDTPNPDTQTAFAIAGALPQYGDAPLTTQLVCNMSYSTAGKIVYYQWDFESDGVNDVYQTEPYHVTHEYPAGEYTATLTIMDEAGYKATAEIKIVSFSPEMQWEVVREFTDSGGVEEGSLGVFIKPSTGLPEIVYVTSPFKHWYTYEEYEGSWKTDSFEPQERPDVTYARPMMLPDGTVIWAGMYDFGFSDTQHIGYVKRNADGTWEPPNYADISIGTDQANLLSAIRPDGQPALLYNVGSTGDVIRYTWWNGESWTREDTGIRGELYGTDFEFINGNPAFTILYPDYSLFYCEKAVDGWTSSLVALPLFETSGRRIIEFDGSPRIITKAGHGLTEFKPDNEGHWIAARGGESDWDYERFRMAYGASGYLVAGDWNGEPFRHVRYSYKIIPPDGEYDLTADWKSGIILSGAYRVLANPVFAPDGTVYVVVEDSDSNPNAVKMLRGSLE